MKIKVCGLKEPKNIEAITALPIDMMGLIFYDKSPRFVEFDEEAMAKINTHETKRVGVFVNPQVDEIFNGVHDFQLDFIQLHGEESAQFCAEIKMLWQASTIRSAKIIKAFPVDENFDFSIIESYQRHVDLFLFDTKGAARGGNGETFDWELLRNYQGMTPFLLSGGIDIEHAAAIRKLNIPQLYGVDINSKFETEPGVKDVAKVQKFVDFINV